MRISHQARAAVVVERCRVLAGFSEDQGSIRRTFLSPPMQDCHRELAAWLAPLAAEVHVDAAGNLRALYPGAQSDAPRLLIGSHLDTVPNAGAFDGVLGVVLGVALLELLDGRRLPFAIELIGFSDEEGVRFGTPFIGSRALAGTLDDEVLNKTDRAGISVRQAIENSGARPSELSNALLHHDTFAYLEFHIEQGPVLDALGLPLAPVKAIAGQSRFEFIFTGRANHAGTTPMHLRHDALAAASEWVTEVEREALRVPGLVATVGSFEALPGAANVIAGEARVTLDVRHGTDEIRTRSVALLIQSARGIAARRRLAVRHRLILNQNAVAMDAPLTSQVAEAIRRAGCRPHAMVSGAGHDAMILAEKVPAAMIFLRTPNGVSHDPAETVEPGDVACAIEAGSHLLELLAAAPAIQRRTRLA